MSLLEDVGLLVIAMDGDIHDNIGIEMGISKTTIYYGRTLLYNIFG